MQDVYLDTEISADGAGLGVGRDLAEHHPPCLDSIEPFPHYCHHRPTRHVLYQPSKEKLVLLKMLHGCLHLE